MIAIDTFLKEVQNDEMNWNTFCDFNKVLNIKEHKETIYKLEKIVKSSSREDLNINIVNFAIEDNSTIGLVLLLIATRKKKLNNKYKDRIYKDKNKKYLSKILDESGLIKFLYNNKDIDLYSYLVGVEIGLDTHSRKNRGGKSMEMDCVHKLIEFAEKNKFNLYIQPSLKKYGVDKRVDFFLEREDIKIAIETNRFNSQGSKMKAVSEEYTQLSRLMETSNIEFVWITDGNAWIQNKNVLRKNMDNISHFINLKKLNNGYLDIFLEKKADIRA